MSWPISSIIYGCYRPCDGWLIRNASHDLCACVRVRVLHLGLLRHWVVCWANWLTVSLRHDQVYNEWPSPAKRQGVVC
jgi:hypothetical protein